MAIRKYRRRSRWNDALKKIITDFKEQLLQSVHCRHATLSDCITACLYEAGWPVSELARQRSNPGLYERDSIVSQPRANPSIGSHVLSFFSVKLKERGNISCSFNFTKERMFVGTSCDKGSAIFRNLLCSVRASQTGCPVSSFYTRKFKPFQAGSGHLIHGMSAKRVSPAH